jgi:hypothetical protein
LPIASPEALAGTRRIQLFLMDVDSTLMDGGVHLIYRRAVLRAK